MISLIIMGVAVGVLFAKRALVFGIARALVLYSAGVYDNDYH